MRAAERVGAAALLAIAGARRGTLEPPNRTSGCALFTCSASCGGPQASLQQWLPAGVERSSFVGDGCVRWFTVEVPAGGGFFTAAAGQWSSATYTEADLATTNVVVTVDG